MAESQSQSCCRPCPMCAYYTRMMHDDSHFAAQHYQAKITHRLYGVCSERGH